MWFQLAVLLFLIVFSATQVQNYQWRSVVWLILAIILAIIAVLLALGRIT